MTVPRSDTYVSAPYVAFFRSRSYRLPSACVCVYPSANTSYRYMHSSDVYLVVWMYSGVVTPNTNEPMKRKGYNSVLTHYNLLRTSDRCSTCTQLAKMSTDPQFVELTADVANFFFYDVHHYVDYSKYRRSDKKFFRSRSSLCGLNERVPTG